MSDNEPGTVAVATVRGVKGVRVMRVRNLDGWVDENGYAHTPEGHGLDTRTPVTDIRPLVVLDLDESVGRSLLPVWLRNNISKVEEGSVSPTSIGKDMRWLADQIEAQTAPPKPTEPSGIGAVVEDSSHVRWVRVSNTPGTFPWLRDGHGVRGWSEIDAVTVLSEGVTS